MPYQLPPPCYPIIFPLSPSVLLPHSHSSFSVPSIYYSITMSITPRSRYRSCFNLILQSLLNTIRPFTPPSSRYICYSLSLSLSLSLSVEGAFFKKWANPASFSFILVFSNTHYNFLQQINVKNVHLVYCAGIRAHYLWNMSLFP